MTDKGREGYTIEERERLYYLVDSLPSTYFGMWPVNEWEDIILELAKIVEEKRKRLPTNVVKSACPLCGAPSISDVACSNWECKNYQPAMA